MELPTEMGFGKLEVPNSVSRLSRSGGQALGSAWRLAQRGLDGWVGGWAAKWLSGWIWDGAVQRRVEGGWLHGWVGISG